MQQGSRGYRENFISIKKLHGNRSRAQGTQQPSYPLVFHYFWEHLNEEDIQSATWPRENRADFREERDSRYLSINWLTLLQSPDNPISTWSRAPLSPHLWFEIKPRSQPVSWEVPTIIRLSLIRWSYNRLTSIIINGQKKDKSIL